MASLRNVKQALASLLVNLEQMLHDNCEKALETYWRSKIEACGWWILAMQAYGAIRHLSSWGRQIGVLSKEEFAYWFNKCMELERYLWEVNATVGFCCPSRTVFTKTVM